MQNSQVCIPFMHTVSAAMERRAVINLPPLLACLPPSSMAFSARPTPFTAGMEPPLPCSRFSFSAALYPNHSHLQQSLKFI